MAFASASSSDARWIYPLRPPTSAGEMLRITGVGEALPERSEREAPARAVEVPERAGEATALDPSPPPPPSSGSRFFFFLAWGGV